jgi:hypothetical protein
MDEIGKLTFMVTYWHISEVFHLSTERECWFKKVKVEERHLNQFLKREHTNPDWSRGISRKWLKDQWREVLKIIQRYLTCDGRYSIINKFHMRFLLHITGDNKLNLPFFLHRSLLKMSEKFQKHPNTPATSLIHPVVIKRLATHELNNLMILWDAFIKVCGFSMVDT